MELPIFCDFGINLPICERCGHARMEFVHALTPLPTSPFLSFSPSVIDSY